MATSEELADRLTADQLRAFASENSIDVSGRRSKADLSKAVAAEADEEALRTYATSLGVDPDEVDEDGERQPTAQSQARISPADTEALAEAGMSPADLELRLPQRASGESRIVKASPETPTIEQVEASTTEQSEPPDVTITVTDVDGNEVDARVRPDDQAAVAQRTASAQNTHPAYTSKGYWSNPNLTEMTDEEKEKNEEAYAARVD